jgi:LEA14-like dessication related protein
MKDLIYRIYKKVVMAGAVLFAIFSLSTCQTLNSVLQEPRVSLNSAAITNLNFTGAQLLCKVRVENPNAFDIPFPETGWQLFINSNSFVSGVVRNNNRLGARRSTIVDVPVDLKYFDIFNTFNSLRGSQKADYRIALALKFAIPVLGDKVFNLEHKGEFPVLHLPIIRFVNLRVKNISLTNLEVEVNWEVENNNYFAMTVKELGYNLRVNNSNWSNARVSNAPQIAANRKTTVPVTFSTNVGSIVRDVAEIVARGTNVNYALNGNFNLGPALQGLSDINMPFDFSGSTRLLR